MCDTDLPQHAELPTSARLWRSTIIAAISALAILITIVLPSEYGIDPTRVGQMFGLTEMGEIKMQLAREAAADRQAARQAVEQTLANPGAPVPQAPSGDIEQRLSAIEQRLADITVILSTGMPQPSASRFAADGTDERLAKTETNPAVPAERPETLQQAPERIWTDEVSYTLQPGEGIELKLVMQAGAQADFEWTANGSVLNFDTHGDGNGKSVSYEKGRAVPKQIGILRAAFTGNHGWFWRNRTDAPVTLTLRTRGDYSELKRTV